MNPLVIIWRVLTTPQPCAGDLWRSRLDPETIVKVINVRDDVVTFIGHEGQRPPDDAKVVQHAGEFCCFWLPAGAKAGGVSCHALDS